MAYLAAALRRSGHDVSLIFGDGNADMSVETIDGVTCIDAAPQWTPRSLVALWRTLRRLDPDVIYARLPSDFLWILRFYAKQNKAKFIYSMASALHCDPRTAYDYNSWFHGPLFWLGLRGADVIAVQHEQQVSLMPPSFRERAAHIPNLVRSFKAAPRSFEAACYDAVWVGMIRSEKRIECFLDAAAALPDLHFAIIGGFDVHFDPQERFRLEGRMRSMMNLSILGPQRAENVQALLAQSKVLVSTSLVEGFPNVMLEAWSSGVPVISLSVDPGDVIMREGLGCVSGTMEALADDIAELTSNKDLNLQIGARGLSYVRRTHSWESVYSLLMDALPPMAVAEPVTHPS